LPFLEKYFQKTLYKVENMCYNVSIIRIL